ncbi:sigma-B regulation protein RsbU (phosphoserine phosphatase) [Catenulispora sp. EB89]|uniref:PP2C family protein-serine/threonine phosphatase n=1 Tax=Catenulispora sp. EB89 TaxID=3156257 RepID=UPI003514602F
MASPGPASGSGAADRGRDDDERAEFSALLEDSTDDLYEHAPCGYLSTMLDGSIAKINATLLDWLGYRREDVVGRKRFADLLTVGGRLYHETHFAPLLQLQGQVNGIALELRTAAGERMPVLVSSVVKSGAGGDPLLIRTTVFDARDRRAYETELLRARQEAETAQAGAETAHAEADKARLLAEDRSERYQRLAATLQRTLLPPVLAAPAGTQVAAHYHIASIEEVGGDFYDLFPLPAGRWGLFLGDVCGKGAAAAAVTSLARYALRSAAVFDSEPAEVLANVNSVFNQEFRGPNVRYCTVVFGLLTPHGDGYTAALASGGHPPALLLAADGTATYLPTPGGQLIGVLEHVDIATTTVHLGPGDTLLLYTDGLTEAHNTQAPTDPAAHDDRYGETALLALAARLAPTTAPDLIHALTDLLDSFGHGLDDDTALLALSVSAATSRPADGASQ